MSSPTVTDLAMVRNIGIMAHIDGSSYFGFALGLVLFGFGMGLAGPTATQAIIEALPLPSRACSVSAVNDLSRGRRCPASLGGSGHHCRALPSAIDDHASNLPLAGLDGYC